MVVFPGYALAAAFAVGFVLGVLTLFGVSAWRGTHG